ncbi:MAG: (4Fe-4S)-binding protein [Peptococcaceae bacterium]|jgi:MinD superfamily P-loop ATPase|nr:(4Fe-4S)-binding protein [Peptococcaceae bacterium]MDH7524009.1 (4Fe-4S)-binding protein [Peptococcaceae bacterium]
MLKELVVISGKGGTGKTSIVAALASLLNNKVLADCDVDAADLHLVLQPQILEKKEFWSGKTASINRENCAECGKCLELCRFAAISNDYAIDNIACEGCGVCAYFCPAGAIDLKDNLCGHIFVSRTPHGPMVHARLDIAEENSGKLVSQVRTQARALAYAEKRSAVIVDGPPGTGCPVIASISGASTVLVVTEPTVSGIHDLERVLELARHFRIPAIVCINKWDINPGISASITNKCEQIEARVVGQIPYDGAVTRAQVQGISVLEYDPGSPASLELQKLGKVVESLLNQ